jgi:hypothetical protein
MGFLELLDETGIPYSLVSEQDSEEERKEAHKKAMKKYQQSEKGKTTQAKAMKKYRQSEKGKENTKKANKKWTQTENGKIYYRNLAREKRKKRCLFTQRVKLRYGCSECGYKKCATSLHFDHIDPTTKKNVVSKLVKQSMKQLKNEMRKCRILCANCHGEHTEEQRKERVFV